MTEQRNTIQVLNSWTYRDNLIIVQIKHSEKGLYKNYKLTSKDSSRVWIINSRVIYNHTIELQKRFKDEPEINISLSFKNEKVKIKSQNEIIENEKKGIFHYLIESVYSKDKPTKVEELIIKE